MKVKSNKDLKNIEPGDLIKTGAGYRLVVKIYIEAEEFYSLIDIESGIETIRCRTIETLMNRVDGVLIAKSKDITLVY